MTQLIRNLLPLLLIIYLLIVFVIPTYRIYKESGINPITFGKSDNAHDYIGLVMKMLIAFLFLVGFIYSFIPSIYSYLVPIPYLEHINFQWTGVLIILISIIWIYIAQVHMRQSWRIGIDEKNKTELITSGLFSISRNPIFFGMILSIIGVFLIIPNTLTFFLMMTTYIIIQIQIRLEEEFLEKQHGDFYIQYKLKVRRLI